jgi:hypothetical protein
MLATVQEVLMLVDATIWLLYTKLLSASDTLTKDLDSCSSEAGFPRTVFNHIFLLIGACPRGRKKTMCWYLAYTPSKHLSQTNGSGDSDTWPVRSPEWLIRTPHSLHGYSWGIGGIF